MPTNGLVVMTPTSIAYSGTSASINADGSVSFSAVTSLSLNGVFTGDYDNYMISIDGIASTTHTPGFRLRASGADATGSNYTYQYLRADGTSVAGSRASAGETYPHSISSTPENGGQHYLYGPYLAQPTAGRSVSATQSNGAYIWDLAWTHSLSSSYDGFTFQAFSYTLTGRITVFGFNQ